MSKEGQKAVIQATALMPPKHLNFLKTDRLYCRIYSTQPIRRDPYQEQQNAIYRIS